MSNGDSSHALGESVDSLMEKTATLMTTFDSNGFQEALQNTCQQSPGKNLPVWPRGLRDYSRPSLDKAPQAPISAQISASFGRPWNADQVDSGLFISTAEMKPTPVNYTAEAVAQMQPELVAAAVSTVKGHSAAVPMKMPTMPPAPKATQSPAPDADCGFSDPNFSIWKIPKCMFTTFGGIPQSKNFFMDHSRYFYLLCWIALLLLIVFLIKKFVIQRSQNPVFFPPQYE